MKELKDIILSPEDARAAIYEDHSDFELVEEEMTDTSRWSIHYSATLRHKSSGNYYYTNYSRGATECQDEQPYEHEKEVVFTAFHKTYPVTVSGFTSADDAIAFMAWYRNAGAEAYADYNGQHGYSEAPDKPYTTDLKMRIAG